MKEMQLTKGLVAYVDDEDYHKVSSYRWHASISGNTFYAKTCDGGTNRVNLGKARALFMHRVILDPPSEYTVDHINHNGLDNRKENLRLATFQQNQQNKRRSDFWGGKPSASRYKGVSWCKDRGKWRATLRHNGKRISLGRYNTEEEAALSYNQKAKEIYGEFAFQNVVGASI